MSYALIWGKTKSSAVKTFLSTKLVFLAQVTILVFSYYGKFTGNRKDKNKYM